MFSLCGGWMWIDNQLFTSNLAAELGTKRYQGKGGRAGSHIRGTQKELQKSPLCSTPLSPSGCPRL
jgi:hypothetical protein